MLKSIKNTFRKYPAELLGYLCSAMLLSCGLALTFHNLVLGLYLAGTGVCIGGMANSWMRKHKRRYRELLAEIQQNGLTDAVMAECRAARSTRRLVNMIAEEMGLKERRQSATNKGLAKYN